ATAGTYARYVNGTMPRDFSPCGEVIRRDAPMLMRQMNKLYYYVSELHEPPHEVLLVPFHRSGAPVGTVWIVRHDDSGGFDAEDLRIVKTLTRFAGAAVESVGKVRSLTASNKEMQEVDTRKEQFMASLAHEMRNPLGAIGLGLEVVKRRGDDAERRGAAIASMERQLAQLTALVSDITDVAAVRSGKLALTLASVSIEEIVANALETQIHTGPWAHCGRRVQSRRRCRDNHQRFRNRTRSSCAGQNF
ncbi:MAG: GAF domain-containing protein, partial [Proteobacteria bacterium]|nr:GAF domain-containing protein [Pseudomonadota bacterium]